MPKSVQAVAQRQECEQKALLRVFTGVAGSLLHQGFPDGLRTAKNLAFRLLEAWRNLSLAASDFPRLAEGAFQIRLDSS